MLDVLKIPPAELFALLVAIGFAAGLNLYATVAVLGLLARFGHLPLPVGLQPLQSWVVIGASVVLFIIEFFADKIPAFDLIWNALHTFIRVPVAGLLAYRATSQLSPEHQLLAALLGAGVAFIAHGGKTAARAAITPSPEPVSNIGLSLGEDVFAIGLTWLATRHPYIAGTVAVVFVLIIILLARLVIRALRASWSSDISRKGSAISAEDSSGRLTSPRAMTATVTAQPREVLLSNKLRIWAMRIWRL